MNMHRYFDSHCHLQKVMDLSALLASAKSADICGFVCNSTRPDDWEQVIDLTEKYINVYGCIGVHPWYIDDLRKNRLGLMRNLLRKYTNLMVGEIGLDKFASSDMDVQEDIFKAQLEIASELNRIVHIHCVGAWDKILRLLKEYKSLVVFHSFSASKEIVTQLLKKDDIYYSFSPDLLDGKHIKMTDAAKAIPLDRLLVESDDQSPLMIPDTVRKLSEIKGIDIDNTVNAIYNNSIRLFKNGQIA